MDQSQQQNQQHEAAIEEKLETIQSDLSETKETVARLDERQKGHDRELRSLESRLRELVTTLQQEIKRVESVFRTQNHNP